MPRIKGHFFLPTRERQCKSTLGEHGEREAAGFLLGWAPGGAQEVRRAKNPHTERVERAAWRYPGAATWARA